MIRKSNLIILIASLLLFSGCASKSPNNPQTGTGDGTSISNPDNQNNSYKIKDFYPFQENVKYVYEGRGNEYAAYSLSIDFIKDNKIQTRKNNGGTETVSVMELKNNELLEVFKRNECYYRENFLSKSESQNDILLKEPLVKGTSWNLSDGRKRYISNVDLEVTTDAGIFKAIEVITEGNNSKTFDYYGLNVGLIKSIYKADDTEVSSTLAKIDKNSPLIQKVKFYYPDIDKDKLYYLEKDLSFNTNALTKEIFENEFKNSPKENLGKLFGANVKINSLYLNDDGMVYLDLSQNFVKEMNAGSGYEVMILQSITNTIGNYYGVDKVYITLEGNSYSSGHILKNKGEYFLVNNNSLELPK